MDAINAVAAEDGNITVIEDAAQSFGATCGGRKSCGLSEIACTSFFPSKPLSCYGDGGAIFTTNDTLAQAMREIRVHGRSARYVHTRIGVGGRDKCERTLEAQGFFHPAPIREAWRQHLSGARNNQYKIWNILMFQNWLETTT